MLHEQTVATLNALRLTGMAKGFAERIGDPRNAELDHADFVGLLAQDEKTHRENQRLKRLLKNAKLKMPACLEDVNFHHPRGLEKAVVRELASGRWIEGKRNVLLTGPTGIGKTWLSNALGNQAARAGYTTLYVRAPRLFETLRQAQGDGTHMRHLSRLAKVQVLIIDDLLLTPLGEQERKDLLEIIEDRHQAGSTVVTSQCPRKQWHEGIGDPTLADAILDRLVHNAHKIALRGDTMRGDKENA
jgi:DNA replication protein DnaC